MFKLHLLVCAAGLAQLQCPSCLAQVTIESVGVLGQDTISSCHGLSGNGQIVVGDSSLDTVTRAWRRVNDSPIQELLLPGWATSGVAHAASEQGQVFVGSAWIGGVQEAVRWTSSEMPGQTLTSGGSGMAVACSGNGDIVAVNKNQRPWTWSAANGLQECYLPVIASDVGFTTGMSSDGTIMVGSAGNGSTQRSYATKWTNRNPSTLENGLGAAVEGISADGKCVIGFSADSRPCRWNQNGQFRLLAPDDPGARGQSRAVNARGEIIVGVMRREPAPNSEAFIWRQSLGIVPLSEYAQSLGAVLDGWELRIASGVSADGTVVVGYGLFNGQERGWVIRGLPTYCRADQTADGALDFFDYDEFVAAFEVGSPTADFDDDGTVDFFDYDDFVVAFETGC